MDLSYAAHNVDQSVQLLYHKDFYYILRPVFEDLFKFDCFKLKCNLALIKLLLVTGFVVSQLLLQNFVKVSFTSISGVLLRAYKLMQTLPHFNRAQLVVVETQSLN